MPRWNDHIACDGTVYSLRHLDDRTHTYRLRATILRADTDVMVRVRIGAHAFTRNPKAGEFFRPCDVYSGDGEGRLFCLSRWEFSKDLPRIAADLLERNCWQTDKNHVLFSRAQTQAGEEYAIFFSLMGAEKGPPACINLCIWSAHPRAGASVRTQGKPVKFRDLLRSRL